MNNLTALISQLEKESVRLASQLHNVNNALSALNVNGASRKGGMSAAGRARIAAAQRARWAKLKGRKVVSITIKRKMSPAARKRIAAAQKARWAKWRREKRTT